MQQLESQSYVCNNCNNNLDDKDKFCSHCGQKRLSENLKLKHLVLQFLEDFFSFDNKLFRTLKVLVLQPGQLAIDYINGKRNQYVQPFRLLIFVAFIATVVISFVAPNAYDGFIELEIPDNQDEAQTAVHTLSQTLKTKSSIIALLDLPILAFFIFILFYKKNRYYVESFIIGAHLQVVFILLLLLSILFSKVSDFGGYSQTFVLVSQFIYSSIALKKYYNNPLPLTLLKTFILIILQFIIVVIFAFLYIILLVYDIDSFTGFGYTIYFS